MAIRVAVDAMGGDHAPAVVVDGAVRAASHASGEIEVLLFGPQETLNTLLGNHAGAAGLPIRIVDAPEVIGMAESPAAAVKGKPRSSIHVGLLAHRSGEADAFVSAGNTGAVMAASLLTLGRVGGVARPSLIGFFPTTRSYCIVLDVGSNVDCKPEHLAQFAQLGSVYARKVMRREEPVVALVNVGEEPGKGSEQVKAAYELLQNTPGIHFKGNIEGRDVLHHGADVVISDGFVGNIMLKLGESMATAVVEMMGAEMQAQGLDEAGRSAVKAVLRGVARRFDYEEYGGAPLLGVNGNVVIGHGGSSARAIERLIVAGADLFKQEVTGAIAEVFHEKAL